MNFGLKNKYALVTGGSHGIGRAIALALAEEGCNVAICAIDEAQVNETAREIKDRGVKSLGIVADVMKPEDIRRTMKKVHDSFGKLHILVNNVGGGGRWGSEVFEETADDVWTDVYNKNAMAAVRFTMAAIPLMKKQKWGRVIAISSIYGREGGGRPWFNMAKSAEISLMKTLAMKPDLARSQITFNSIAPGPIMIPDTGWEKEQKTNPNKFKETLERLPLGRLGTPEEVANLAAFLCSEKASLINGACVPADGGDSHSF